MYGIVEISGHQYQVDPGRIIDVELQKTPAGETFDLDKVMMLSGNGQSEFGAPYINQAHVKVKVLQHKKDKKVLVFKRAPGKWQKRMGHRQNFTSLLVLEINKGGETLAKIDPESAVSKNF